MNNGQVEVATPTATNGGHGAPRPEVKESVLARIREETKSNPMPEDQAQKHVKAWKDTRGELTKAEEKVTKLKDREALLVANLARARGAEPFTFEGVRYEFSSKGDNVILRARSDVGGEL